MMVRLQNHSPLGKIFAAGLKNVDSSREVMKESIEEAGRVVAHDLDRYLTTLGTIASLSPLMGLFGTLVGMMKFLAPTRRPVAIQRSLPTAFPWHCIMLPLAYWWQFQV